jgi:hypothetical protein
MYSGGDNMNSFESFAKVRQDIAQRKYDESIRKKQNRHDWLIAIFNILGGAVGGLVTSLIFWFITA